MVSVTVVQVGTPGQSLIASQVIATTKAALGATPAFTLLLHEVHPQTYFPHRCDKKTSPSSILTAHLTQSDALLHEGLAGAWLATTAKRTPL